VSGRRSFDPTAGEFNGLDRVEATLPSVWYYDQAHYEREFDAIWSRQWIYLCRADSVPEPRSFRTFSVGTQPIVLLRDEAGELRAFYNVCRHRGSALCTESAGRLPATGLTCPYHAWTYRMSGELARIPGGRPHGVDIASTRLYPLAVSVWRGFVYVALSTPERAFDDNFNANTLQFANWPLEALVVGHRVTKSLACNWKVFWENYNECLHCPAVHPNLVDMVPIYRRGIMEPRDDPDWTAHAGSPEPIYRGGLRSGAETCSVDGRSLGHEFTLSPEERRLGYHYMTSLPSHYLVLHVDHVRSTRILPLGPEQMELEIEWLFPAETLADPAADIMKACAFSAEVMAEDGRVCELAQRGLRARPHIEGMLMPEEYDVWRFQEWVRRALGV